MRGQVPVVCESSLYPLLCVYLKDPGAAGLPSLPLFAKLLKCSEEEASAKLSLATPAERVRRVAGQLYSAGLRVEAGSLILLAQVFHPGLQTVNSGLEFLSRLF